MDITGLVAGLFPLSVQLTQLAYNAYDVYSCAEGKRSEQLLKLDIERDRFCTWVEARRFQSRGVLRQNFGNTSSSSEKFQRQYGLAFRIILEIIDLLQKVACYELQGGNPAAKKGGFLRAPTITISRRPSFRSFRSSRSNLQQTTSNPGHGISPDFDIFLRDAESKLGFTGKIDNRILEDFRKHLEIAENCHTQKLVSKAEKFRQVFENFASQNNPKLDQLIVEVREWNDALDRLLVEFTDKKPLPPPTDFIIPLQFPEHHHLSHAFRFYGRTKIMERIEENLDFGGNKIVILQGPGGYGKTRIAYECATRYRTMHSAIIWIDASTPETIKDSAQIFVGLIVDEYAKTLPASRPDDFGEVANKLQVNPDIDSNTVITKTVLMETISRSPEKYLRNWLAKSGNDRWLLIADNFDKPEDNETIQALKRLIPDPPAGNLILTTRESNVDQILLDKVLRQGECENIVVRGFTEEKGFTEEYLLSVFAETPIDDEDQSEINSAKLVVKHLESPLLITMAGAYIHMSKDARILFTTYYDQLRGYIQRNGTETSAAEAFVFEGAFNRIPVEAQNLLGMFVAYNPGWGVSEEVFERGQEYLRNTGIDKDTRPGSLLEILLSYRLVDPVALPHMSSGKSYRTFRVHAKIHKWIRGKLQTVVGRYEWSCELAWGIVASTLPLDDDARNDEQRKYEATAIHPHLEYVPHDDDDAAMRKDINLSLEIAKPTDLQRIARACSHLSNYQKAANLYGLVISKFQVDISNEIDVRKLTLNKDPQSILTLLDSMDYLSSTLRKLDDSQGAYEWAGKALRAREELGQYTGVKDPLRVQSALNLALALAAKGEREEALKLYMEMLESHRKTGSPGTSTGTWDLFELKILKAMAEIHSNQERYDDALEILVQIRRDWGDTYPNDAFILDVRTSITCVQICRGKYKEALKECQDLVAKKTEIFGEGHYSVLNTIIEEGDTYISMGSFDLATKCYQQAANGYSKIFSDPDHPAILTALTGIATVLKDQGHFRESLELYERILRGKARTLPGTLGEFDAMNDVAGILNRMGRYEPALRLFAQAEQGCLDALGPDGVSDAVTLASGYGIAQVYQCQGLYNEALKRFQETWVLEKSAYGEDHYSTMITATSIASVLEKQGKFQEADVIYTKAIKGFQKAVGPRAYRTLEAMLGQACLWERQERLSDALAQVELIMEQRKAAPREEGIHDHPAKYWELCTRGRILCKLGRCKEAIPELETGLHSLQRKLSPDHPWILEASHWRARFLADNGHSKQALVALEEVLESRRQRLGPRHPDTSETKYEMGRVKLQAATFGKRRRSYKYAEQHLQEALDELKLSLGEDHPTTIAVGELRDTAQQKRTKSWSVKILGAA